jgi:hypothetical protein
VDRRRPGPQKAAESSPPPPPPLAAILTHCVDTHENCPVMMANNRDQCHDRPCLEDETPPDLDMEEDQEESRRCSEMEEEDESRRYSVPGEFQRTACRRRLHDDLPECLVPTEATRSYAVITEGPTNGLAGAGAAKALRCSVIVHPAACSARPQTRPYAVDSCTCECHKVIF